VTVHYRWHPFAGSKLSLVKTAGITGAAELHCQTPDGIVLGIPRWMTESVRCVSMEIGEPVVGVHALSELRTLLDGLKSA
jgi:hypothetical protein